MVKNTTESGLPKKPDFFNVNGGVDGAKVFGFSWTSGITAAVTAKD